MGGCHCLAMLSLTLVSTALLYKRPPLLKGHSLGGCYEGCCTDTTAVDSLQELHIMLLALLGKADLSAPMAQNHFDFVS